MAVAIETVHEDQISRLHHGTIWHIWDEHGHYRELSYRYFHGFIRQRFKVIDDTGNSEIVTLYAPPECMQPPPRLTEWQDI
jgi:hypothetical protein